MSDPRIVITHPDGRAYSVTRSAFNRIYKPQGFEESHEERPDDFLADVPAPRRARRAPRRKAVGENETE